jgi:hypothetical protein
LRAPAGVMTAPESVIPDGRVELILNFADPSFVTSMAAPKRNHL